MLTKEREKEIRDRLSAFKHWHSVSSYGTANYYESHGPDMEELLAEIDALRAENEHLGKTIDECDSQRFELTKENQKLRELVAKLEKALILIENEPNTMGFFADDCVREYGIKAWNIAHEVLAAR